MNRQTLFLLSLLFILSACLQKNKKNFSAPLVLADSWAIAEPNKEGLNVPALEKLISAVSDENPKINSLTIARHGKLIVDEYFNGYSPDSLHKIWSITKVISSTLIGIAANQGLLSEKDSIYAYFPNYIQDKNSSKGHITIEHLLSMTSGLEWIELGGPKSSGFQLAYSSDWIAFVLDQPHTNVAGKVFNYSSGNSMLLAPIIKKACKVQANEYAQKHLFTPLNITNYEWDKQSEFWTKTQNGELPGAKPPGHIHYQKPFAYLTNTGSGLRMRSRDLCKLGQLYLNQGKWNGKQIVSQKWIKQSTQTLHNNSYYGYHWQGISLNNHHGYCASGFGLQKIFVFPKFDLVVVMTQQHYQTMPEGEKWTKQFLIELLETIDN